jgi:hypothetical protein
VIGLSQRSILQQADPFVSYVQEPLFIASKAFQLAKNVCDKLREAHIKPIELNAETFGLRTESKLSPSQLRTILHLTLGIIKHSDP